ncbi:MAG: NAD(P)-dependent alcohol dehydrogenase [Verrucomicrobiota bacterium]
MKTLYFEKYGNSEVLSFRDLPQPTLSPGYVLVKVHTASVNPLDWRLMQANPFIVRMSRGWFKPTETGLGADISGVIESTATDVADWSPGDEVFGIMTPEIVGSFAEYVAIPKDALVRKPRSLSHAQASTLGVAALTAYEGIHDYKKPQAGDRVLINGASGGIGTFTIQMAKAYGAHVTAVCSGGNHELVRRLGADAAIDYKTVDLLKIEERFDLIFDVIGNHPPKKMKRLLNGNGRLVLASAATGLGFLKAIAISRKKQEPIDLILDLKKDKQRLEAVLALFQEGKMKPVIDRDYPFDEVPDAIDYVATQRARGKVVVHITQE